MSSPTGCWNRWIRRRSSGTILQSHAPETGRALTSDSGAVSEKGALELSTVEVDGDPSDSALSCWEPFFLRRSVLLGLFTFFFLQIVALITLYAYSSMNQGIVQVAETYHQL